MFKIVSRTVILGNSTIGYGSPKNFASSSRLGFNIKEDEVSSSEEAAKEKTVNSDGKLARKGTRRIMKNFVVMLQKQN